MTDKPKLMRKPSADNLMHQLWSKAASDRGYDKKEWMALERAIAAISSQPQPTYAQDVPHMIVFDDDDRKPEIIIGRERALKRYVEISVSWNANLFVKIDSNSRDCTLPNAAITSQQQGAQPASMSSEPATADDQQAQTDNPAISNTSEEKRECWSANEEDFRYDGLGELLDNHDELVVGNTVFVGEAEVPSYSQLCDSDDVMTMMGERAYDIAGEYAENFPDVSKDAERELDALLRAWMEKHCSINFWTVKNVRPYVLTEEDVPAVEVQSIAAPTALTPESKPVQEGSETA